MSQALTAHTAFVLALAADAAFSNHAAMQVRIEGQPLSSVLGIKSRFIGNGGEECSVEELALQYYAAEDRGAWTGVLPSSWPRVSHLHANQINHM